MLISLFDFLSFFFNQIRSSELSKDQRTPSSVWKSWMIPVLRKRSLTRVTPAFPEEELFKEKSIHVNKRTCNTATCVTQRLADFLSRSDKNLGPFYIPTNVGSNTYGKRDSVGSYSRDPLNYLQL
uniref:Islet amyloid polypeptide n=1 Tax=Callorhinchus milii TaxID=7868 RepID=A0A4W3J2E2_CALMI